MTILPTTTGLTAIITTTDMTDTNQSLLRLMTWMSPAFPVGGFAYSSGLEATVREGHVVDADGLRAWLETLIERGALWNDLVYLSEAWRNHSDPDALASTIELAIAMAGSAERFLEITSLGDAFMEAASAWPHEMFETLQGPIPYAIAVGVVAATNDVPLNASLTAFLHAALSQSVSAAIRLSAMGQKQGVAILAALEPQIMATAERAANATIEDLGSATVIADIMTMRHETLYSRIFRS